MITKPQAGQYPVYYQKYLDLLVQPFLETALSETGNHTMEFFASLDPSKHDLAYAEDKWNPKEVLAHIIDTERILSYRALCIARKDPSEFPGFDENLYASHSNAKNRRMEALLEEFETVRLSTLHLFRSFTPEMIEQTGIANKNKVSVNAIGWFAAGHGYHHCCIVAERY